MRCWSGTVVGYFFFIFKYTKKSSTSPHLNCTIDDGTDYSYFSGGYDVRQYGSFMADFSAASAASEAIDCFQIEAPAEVRWWDDEAHLEPYSKILGGKVIAKFFQHYYM